MKTCLAFLALFSLIFVSKGQMPVLYGSGLNEEGKANGMAYLHWTSQEGELYEIQRCHSQSTTWVKVGESARGVFVDSAYICGDTLAYRLCLAGQYSNIIRLWIEDRTAPEPVNFYAIQVENFNRWTVLRWDACKTKDLLGYVVGTGNLLEYLDTVKGRANTTYIDSLAAVSTQRVYRVMSIDKCYNRSVFLQDRYIFAAQLTYSSCADSLRLNWAPTSNMISEVQEFHINASFNKGASFLVGKVSCTASSFTFPVFKNNGQYDVFVTAVDTVNGITANSSYDSILIDIAALPSVFRIKNVDVLPEGKAEIEMDISEDGLFLYFEIFREDVFSGLQKVAKVKFSDKEQMKWMDQNGHPEFSFSNYYARLWDTCENLERQTDLFSSLFLKFESMQADKVVFVWNAQEMWEDGVKEYELIQRNTRTQIEKRLETFPFEGIMEYKKEVQLPSVKDMLESEYYVQGISNGLPSSVSRSNRVRLYKEGEIIYYLPNGFFPKGGHANGFGPIGIFLDDDQLEFRVFDRYGNLIFFSRSFASYWDGTYKGEYVASGAYVYQVKISRDGLDKIERGTVVVVY